MTFDQANGGMLTAVLRVFPDLGIAVLDWVSADVKT